MRGSPIIHQAINILPSPDRRYGGRSDYVVRRIDDVDRVDFDNETATDFVIKVNSAIYNLTYSCRIARHLNTPNWALVHCGKCSFFFKNSALPIFQKANFLVLGNSHPRLIRKKTATQALTLSYKNPYTEICRFSKVSKNRVLKRPKKGVKWK